MKNSSHKIVSRVSAFTLIELLVVVSIIAVLIAMLLPALDRARGEAQSIVCLSLHKQFGVSLFLYMDNNEDELPLFASGFPSAQPGSHWQETIMEYINEDNVDLTGVNTFNESKLFLCPSGQKDAAGLLPGLGVNYGGFKDLSQNPPAIANSPIVYGQPGPGLGAIKRSEVNYPSTWIVTFDTYTTGGFQYTYNNWNPGSGVDTDADGFPDTAANIMQYFPVYQYNGARPRVHRDIASVLLVDGHAERMDYYDFRGKFVQGGFELHNYFRDDI